MDARLLPLSTLLVLLFSTAAPAQEFFQPQAFDQILGMVRADPETAGLVAAVQSRLGYTNPADLLRSIQISPDLGNTSFGGAMVPAESIAYFQSLSSLNDTDPSWSFEIAQARKNAFDSRETTSETTHRLEVLLAAPTIRVRPNLPLTAAYSTLVHELTHLRGYPALDEDDPIDFYRNAADYVERIFVARGGELEAYTAEGRALRRLEKRLGVDSRNALVAYFDAEGRVKDRGGLKTFILDTLKYRAKLTKDYKDQVAAKRRNTVDSRDWHLYTLRPGIEERFIATGRDFYREYLSRIDAEVDRLNRRIRYADALLSR